MDLSCRLDTVGGQPVLLVHGEIDLATVPALRDQLARALAEHHGRTLFVDLDGVTVLDDTGLGVLLGAAGTARTNGGDVVVVCSSPRLHERFAVTGLARAITVTDSINAAR